ncbi:splicing factor 1 [[Emmonsia] crescens]|uniref:Splicing factor 1 n=1 Tax=[Emmonsia] crescens TaxID=73230 RepID=A0A2B7ZCH2_9EURO|nr:splicing factor 1 [Emmonsia crescens]
MAVVKNNSVTAADNDANDPSSNMEPGTARDDDSSLDLQLSIHVLNKIDRHILPLLFVTYNFNFMDKIILASASVFGIREDNHLVGSQYSWVSSVFYFGYLFWAYPTSILIQKLPVGRYVSLNAFFWGAVVALTAACTNFGGLITVRFLLGVAEGTISPAFVYITAMWWTREEIPARCGIWFAGNSLGGLLSNFLAFGIGHIKQPLAAWQWLFIVLGVATFLWGFFLLFLLPNTIASCKFLNEREKRYAEKRVTVAGTGKARHEWKQEQMIECLKDPKTYMFLSISILTQIPNGGTQNFGNLVLKGFGFTALETTLITTPASVISISTILLTGWLSGKYQNGTTYLMCGIVAFPVAGSAIIYSNVSKGAKLFGYYLLSTGPAVLPLAMSLVAVNYKGSTKKMTMTALLFIVYCAGNIAGPQFFISAEAPHYFTAFLTILICYALVVVAALTLRFYLRWTNMKRDKMEREPVVEPESHRFDKPQSASQEEEEEEEITDLYTRGFRYRM